MTTQKYYSSRIEDLLRKINHEILIPGIQRPYIWEAEQVTRLFDSLMRGYPINTFLFWELKPENFGDWEIYRFIRNFRQGDIHNDKAAMLPHTAATLVLDGQQRLTSLLIGLTGSYTVKNGLRGKGSNWIAKILVLNLLHSPIKELAEDDGASASDLYYGFKFVPADRMPKNDQHAVWLKVSLITQLSDRDQLAATIDRLLLLNPDLDDSQQSLLRSNITRLWQVVHEEECIAYYVEREQSYDKVLDIFIRANDGGTKLSRSDLLMSMVTLRWEQFNARSETEAVTYRMREALAHDTAFDRDYLLRAGLFFNDLDFAFQLRNFTPRNIAIIESNWTGVKRALLMTADLFVQFGIRGGALTGVNSVMLVACYLFKANQGKVESEWDIPEGDADRIRRWIISVLFHGVLSGAANVTMEFYRRIVNEQLKLSRSFPVQELSNRMTLRGRSMTYDSEAAGRFAAHEVKSRIGTIALSLLYARCDWSVKDWQLVQVIPTHLLLDDRLRVQGVPNEEIGVYQSWAGRLANQMILTDEEAKAYYSMDLEAWARSRTPEFWARHHLPSDPALYEEFAFLEFITARKQLLASHLERVLLDVPDTPSEASAHAAPGDQNLAAPLAL